MSNTSCHTLQGHRNSRYVVLVTMHVLWAAWVTSPDLSADIQDTTIGYTPSSLVLALTQTSFIYLFKLIYYHESQLSTGPQHSTRWSQ